MNVEIGSETLIFLFWEYLFRNFGILSLQCSCCHLKDDDGNPCQYHSNILKLGLQAKYFLTKRMLHCTALLMAGREKGEGFSFKKVPKS
jgi:hypothetical protein